MVGLNLQVIVPKLEVSQRDVQQRSGGWQAESAGSLSMVAVLLVANLLFAHILIIFQG